MKLFCFEKKGQKGIGLGVVLLGMASAVTAPAWSTGEGAGPVQAVGRGHLAGHAKGKTQDASAGKAVFVPSSQSRARHGQGSSIKGRRISESKGQSRLAVVDADALYNPTSSRAGTQAPHSYTHADYIPTGHTVVIDPRPSLRGNPGSISDIVIDVPPLSEQCRPGVPGCPTEMEIGLSCPRGTQGLDCQRRQTRLQRAKKCFRQATGDVISSRSAIGMCKKPTGQHVLIAQPIDTGKGTKLSPLQVTQALDQECKTHKAYLEASFVPYLS